MVRRRIASASLRGSMPWEIAISAIVCFEAPRRRLRPRPACAFGPLQHGAAALRLRRAPARAAGIDDEAIRSPPTSTVMAFIGMSMPSADGFPRRSEAVRDEVAQERVVAAGGCRRFVPRSDM
jgi:hypothetical protein